MIGFMLYTAIADSLRADMAKGRWAIGDQLPTLAELQRLWADGADPASRGMQTIRSAYRILIDEGLVEARRSRGYFLRALPPTSLSQLTERLLYSTQLELLLTAIRGGVSLHGLGAHLPTGLSSVYEGTLTWISEALGRAAIRRVSAWEIRGEVPVYTDKAGIHVLTRNGTWVLGPVAAKAITVAG